MKKNTFLSSTSNNPRNFTGIKICGLQDEECVDAAVTEFGGANAIGFVFVESSPRCISRNTASQLVAQLPEDVVPIAVLQDYERLDEFSDWKGWLQLCGKENESEIALLSQPIIKAIKWDYEEVLRWDGCRNIAAILVDGSTGGEGTTFDVEILSKLIPSLKTPIIIAGGLSPLNVKEVIRKASPHAVDVSSGVEKERGIKDPKLISEFIKAVRMVDMERAMADMTSELSYEDWPDDGGFVNRGWVGD